MYKDEKVGLLCSNLPNGMRSLTQEEELSFNGGSWIVIGGVLFFVGFGGMVAIGAYNGYNRNIEIPTKYASSHSSKSTNVRMK